MTQNPGHSPSHLRTQHHNTKNPAPSKQAPSVINPVTKSQNQDQSIKTQSNTHLGITIRGWLPAASGGRGRRTTHRTVVDLVGGGLRATEPAALPGQAGWGWSR